MIQRILIILLLGMAPFSLLAQKDMSKKILSLAGKVTSAEYPDTLGKGLNKAVVEIYAEGKKIASDTASSSGVYKIKKIPYSPSIQIVFKDSKHLTKMIDMDVTEFGDDNAQTVAINMDVVLYKDHDYMGVNFLKSKPFGKGKYSMKEKGVLWDDNYYFQMRDRLDAVLKAYSE